MPIDDYLDRIGTTAGSGSQSASVEPRVFWKQGPTVSTGNQRVVRPGQIALSETAPGGVVRKDEYKSLSEAQGEFYRWSEDDRRKWGQHLLALGLIDEGEENDYNTLRDMWMDVVSEAANFTTAGKQVDPWKVATLIAGDTSSGGAAGRSKGFTGSKSQTRRSVDLTDPSTAKALVNDVLSRQLGRAATDAEVEEFRNVLNAAERANPTVTSSTTTYQNGDAVSQSSTTSGGLGSAGAQQVVEDAVSVLPERQSYQAAATYFNALLGSLGSPVSV